MVRNNLMALRKLHGQLHEKLESHKKQLFCKDLIKKGQAIEKNLSGNKRVEENYPIDLVIPWVDGSDPAWRAEKAKYEDSINNINNDEARFRDWGIFQFWFRAIERYMPWVNRVYFITWGHIPEWLNVHFSKLRIIRHEDIIPKEYLPTFSSHTIEWNIHRIPQLSEHFIYFNDDVFPMKQLDKEDFFCNGLPRYCAITKPIHMFNHMNAHRHARINGFGIMNSYFDIKQCIENNPEKWFTRQYGEDIKYNIRTYEEGEIYGMHLSHLGVPFRKSTMEAFCKEFSESVKSTCQRRFRSSDDIMHQCVQMWEIFHGTFEPVGKSYYGSLLYPTAENIEQVVEAIRGESNRMLCINDFEFLRGDEWYLVRKKVQEALTERFPEKSSFEL